MDRHDKALEMIHKGTVIPAIPLVLNADRKFNEQGQRTLIRYYLDAGVGGIAIAVHTTQFAIRDKGIDLLEPVLQVTKEEIDRYEQKTGKTIVRVSGVCGPIPQAVKEAKLAKKLGYDAVLLSPGGLGALSEDEMIERSAAVAAEMPVIGFYLQIACGGKRYSFDYWRRLADIDNVVAIKCASFNRYQTIDLARGCAFSKRSDEVTLYTGNDDNIVIDLLTKYRFNVNGKIVEKHYIGGLLGHWSVWTKKAVELYNTLRKYQDKDEVPAELLTLAEQVTDCNGAFFDVAHNFAGCIAGVHEVLRRQGLIEGIWCLDPNETLSPGQAEEIDRVYKMYPELNDDAFVHENIEKWRH